MYLIHLQKFVSVFLFEFIRVDGERSSLNIFRGGARDKSLGTSAICLCSHQYPVLKYPLSTFSSRASEQVSH